MDSLPFDTDELWAEVILPLPLPKVYTYSIPHSMVDKAIVGCRAEVVFGKNKRYAGIIKGITNVAPSFPTKPLVGILDANPILHQYQLDLWRWISSYYVCSEGEVMAAALPANFKLNSETNLLYNDDFDGDLTAFNDDEYLVAEALQLKKQLQLSEVQQILGTRSVYQIVRKLSETNLCFVWEKMQDKIKPKTESVVLFHPEFDSSNMLEPLLNNWKGAPKQMELVLAFLHLQNSQPIITQAELLKKAQTGAATLQSLCEKKILQVQKQIRDRISLMPQKIFIDFELSLIQHKAYEALLESMEKYAVNLLHGVTGSGKTLLYIKLIEKYLLQGKQVLYLLPEIALTAQIIRRLQKHFGGHVAIYHSRFNDQERVELWNKIKNREVTVLLGARSALFLPFQDLGLVIVDEEHDPSYKQQDPAPRYHARDAAIFYASMFGAKTMLGSGTPSLESYYNASTGKFGLVSLLERFGGLALPEMHMVHAQNEKTKGRTMITDSLKTAIEETLNTHKQVILFQNRRGYHPYLVCGACGDIPKCKHCDVSLTLHKYSNKLHCHYCGSTYPKLVQCVACGSVKWTEKNFGTERIEEELELLFPKAKVSRMDVDSVRGKTAHETLIAQFEKKEIDILVGTQMVVKGLDFDHVSLVGILDADGLTSFANFRANERAFQLMEQVSGRAGRKGKQGQVIIQALNLNHPVLLWVSKHGFEEMYKHELQERKQFFYPPFSRMIQLTLKHKDEKKLHLASQKLATSLRVDFRDNIIGPAAPIISRIRDQYLMDIMIKLPKDNLTQKNKEVVRRHIDLLLAEPPYRSIFISIDIDPY